MLYITVRDLYLIIPYICVIVLIISLIIFIKIMYLMIILFNARYFIPYSCVMFKGQVERKASSIKQLLVYSDRAVVVAINPECVHLFKEATDSSPRV